MDHPFATTQLCLYSMPKNVCIWYLHYTLATPEQIQIKRIFETGVLLCLYVYTVPNNLPLCSKFIFDDRGDFNTLFSSFFRFCVLCLYLFYFRFSHSYQSTGKKRTTLIVIHKDTHKKALGQRYKRGERKRFNLFATFLLLMLVNNP